MTKISSHRKIVIGRYEDISVFKPDIVGIPSKVDTGAFRSAIHATDIKIVRTKSGRVLKCRLLGHRCHPESFDFTTKKFEKVNITNSFGHSEDRYEVNLRIKLGPKVFTTSFTLADRSESVFPVLLGRKLLKGRFLVDPAESGINRRKLKKQFKIKTLDEEDME